MKIIPVTSDGDCDIRSEEGRMTLRYGRVELRFEWREVPDLIRAIRQALATVGE